MTFCFCSLQWSTFHWTECRSGYCVSVYTNDFISLEIFINNLPYCSPTNWNDFFSFGSWNLGQLECLHVQLTVLRNCVWFFFFFFLLYSWIHTLSSATCYAWCDRHLEDCVTRWLLCYFVPRWSHYVSQGVSKFTRWDERVR